MKIENGHMIEFKNEYHIYSRNNNMEISGIPLMAAGENLATSFMGFSLKLGVCNEARDSDNIHRIPSKNPKMP